MKGRYISLRVLACLFVAILPAVVGLKGASAASTQQTGVEVSDNAQPEQTQSSDATPIGEFLEPDGTLNLAVGFSGNLDPGGYTMQTGPGGEPRFVPTVSGSGEKQPTKPGAGQPDAPVGSYTWDSRFNPIGTSSSDQVNALAVNGMNVYLGGEFSVAGKVAAQNVALWDGSQWSALGSGVNGPIYTMAYSGGNLYVGGNFTQAGGLSAQNIARWDGSAWHAVGSGANGLVYSITPGSGTDIYVGGTFGAAGGNAMSHVARWDGSAWHALGSGTNGTSVSSIAISGQDVYVGGQFTTAGGVAISNLARWDGSTWYGVSGGVGGSVFEVAFFGADLYVGGMFSSAGGNPGFNNIAMYRPSANQWYTLGAGVSGPVYALAASTIGYGMYVGGEFSAAGGVNTKNVAMWSTSGGGWSGLGVGTSNGTTGTVLDLAVTANGYLFAGGFFDQAGGPVTNGGVVANSVARWYGYSWSALGTGLGVTDSDGVINAVLAYTIGGTTYVYVAGVFATVGGIQAYSIARWDGSAWSTLGSGVNNGVHGTVLALTRGPGSEIYVGGSFGTAGGIVVNNLARWSSSIGWSALNSGVNGVVAALAYNNYDLRLYVGGSFSAAVGGVQANNIARWSSSSGWTNLAQGTTLSNGVDGGVNSIVIRDSNHKVYVGGNFDSAGGLAASNLAGWGPNGTANFWFIMGSANAPVNALAFLNDELYAGGDFTGISGVAANRVARFNFTSSSWFALGSGQANGVNGSVHALSVTGNTIYAGGDFTTAGGASANHVAGWGSGWFSMGGGITADYSPLVNAVAADGTTVYAGGLFTLAGGKPSQDFARYYYVPPLPMP